MAAGSTTTLTAAVRDDAGDPLTGRTVTRSSSNTALATVNGGAEHRISPVLVSGGHVFTEVSSGFATTCGRTTDGEIWCRGRGTDDQIGDLGSADRAASVMFQGFGVS